MPTNFNRKAIENGRADYAYRCVDDVKENKKKKEYKSQVKGFPMLIKVNGLAAAVAFAKGKNEEHFNKIIDHLWGWFDENGSGFWDDFKNQPNNPKKDLTKYLVSLDSEKYRLATMEVMELLQWLRRFADGLIKSD